MGYDISIDFDEQEHPEYNDFDFDNGWLNLNSNNIKTLEKRLNKEYFYLPASYNEKRLRDTLEEISNALEETKEEEKQIFYVLSQMKEYIEKYPEAVWNIS